MKDFTFKMYKEFLLNFKRANFQFVSVEDFFTQKYEKNKPFIMIRHDVDRKPENSLAMAKLENEMGVAATYYFRTMPHTFKRDIIQKIARMGHEIAYHYESLAECQGNYDAAIKDFEKNLKELRKLYPVKNIAMHGRPLSNWDSRLLWEKYDYKKYSILSESYLDIDFTKILYITDAGRRWDNDMINLRDKVNTAYKYSFSHTLEIIEKFNDNTLPKQIMVNTHPEHWAKNTNEWYKIYLIRMSKNFIKQIIIRNKK